MNVETIVRRELDGSLITDNARLFTALMQDSGLEQRATLTLLTSATLILLTMVPIKPTSVQMLGFTLESGHWIVLGASLSASVIYYARQLRLSWQIEERRQRYVIDPLRIKLGEQISARMADVSAKLSASTNTVLAAAVDGIGKADAMELDLREARASYESADKLVQDHQRTLRKEYEAQRVEPEVYLQRDADLDKQRATLRAELSAREAEIKGMSTSAQSFDLEESAALNAELAVLKAWADDTLASAEISKSQKLLSSRLPFGCAIGANVVFFAVAVPDLFRLLSTWLSA